MTTTIKLHLSLPDDLAQEIKDRGLLEPAALTELLREAARKRRNVRSSSPRIETAVVKAQELVRRYVPAGSSPADELIAERRAEARRE